MARNGKKTGGGSRKGKPNKSRDEVRDLIDKVLGAKEYGGTDFIWRKLAELGAGIEMAEVKDGETRVYSKEPNVIALKTLAEYRYGKPPQPMEHSGEIGLTKFVEDLK